MTILCKNGFGGADIKIAGASGLMLGFMGGSADTPVITVLQADDGFCDGSDIFHIF